MTRQQADGQLHRKRGKLLFWTCALVLLLCSLTGCGKTLASGGESYPYEIKRASNGTLKIKLDGSKTPDQQWIVEGNDTYYSVYQQGEEKDGVITFLIRPVKLCDGASCVIRRKTKKSDKPGAVLRMMLTVDSNRTGNGLVANLVKCQQSEPGQTKVLGEGTNCPIRYYQKETGELVLTVKNLSDWDLQVENDDSAMIADAGEKADANSGSDEKAEQTDTEQTDTEQTDAEDESEDNGDENLSEDNSENVGLSEDGEETLEPQWDLDRPAKDWSVEGDETLLDQEEVQDLLEISDTKGGWLGAEENEQGLCWYQDPGCHLRRGLSGVSQDGESMLITFEAGSVGYSNIILESESANCRLKLGISVDELGMLTIRKTGYDKADAADDEGNEDTDESEDVDESEE